IDRHIARWSRSHVRRHRRGDEGCERRRDLVPAGLESHDAEVAVLAGENLRHLPIGAVGDGDLRAGQIHSTLRRDDTLEHARSRSLRLQQCEDRDDEQHLFYLLYAPNAAATAQTASPSTAPVSTSIV